MFIVANLRIFFLTRHVSLREAIERVRRSRVEELIAHARRVLVTFGIPDPCIAVAGLNPHASEHGLFGHEETAELIPAIEAAQARGWRVRTAFDIAGRGIADATSMREALLTAARMSARRNLDPRGR